MRCQEMGTWSLLKTQACPDFETAYLKFMPLSTGPRYPYAVEHSGSSAGRGDGGGLWRTPHPNCARCNPLSLRRPSCQPGRSRHSCTQQPRAARARQRIAFSRGTGRDVSSRPTVLRAGRQEAKTHSSRGLHARDRHVVSAQRCARAHIEACIYFGRNLFQVPAFGYQLRAQEQEKRRGARSALERGHGTRSCHRRAPRTAACCAAVLSESFVH